MIEIFHNHSVQVTGSIPTKTLIAEAYRPFEKFYKVYS